MTREEAIDLLDNLLGMVTDNHEADYDEAIKMAIKALSQESKTQMVDKSNFDIEQYKMDLQGAYDCGFEAGKKAEQEPCTDAVSREAVLKEFYDMENLYERIKQLPSVNPSRPIDIEIRDLKWQIASKDQVIEDIKNDIRHIVDEESEIDETWARGLHYALCIIEKHWNCGAIMVEPQERSNKE